MASSLRSELNLEPELRIYSDENWNVSFYGVFRPIYEAAFDFATHLYGSDPDPADFGTGGAFPNNITAFQSGRGEDLFDPANGVGPGFLSQGGQLEGEFTIMNSDTGTLFDGKLVPAIGIDPVVFFGEGLPVEEVAETASTIPYELLVGIGDRVPRVVRE